MEYSTDNGKSFYDKSIKRFDTRKQKHKLLPKKREDLKKLIDQKIKEYYAKQALNLKGEK